jgi:hypothetical protein
MQAALTICLAMPPRVGRDIAFGIRGRERDAHRPALRHAKQHRPLGTDGVHDGPHIIHPLLDGR